VKAVEEGEGRITVFVWMDREIIGVFPGQDETAFGLALDVGTTTVALYLCDLKNGDVVASASVTNPQVLFGADIMSRIAYSSDHPVVGARTMQGELIHAVNTLIDQTATANNLSPKRMMDMTVVGNTVMHHIFLGIPPDQLGLWPFSPSVQGSVDVKARDIGLIMNPSANVYVLPVQAGFVGADNVGVLLSAEPQGTDDLSLVVDLGTNGEIVLGNRERLMSCSCATGPAFEGAQISSGMRATAGAMERVRIDSATLDPDYAVVGKKGWASEHPLGELRPVGICGSGIIDAVAHLYKTGVIKKNGVFSEGLDTPRVKKVKGITEFVLAWGEETATGADIVLTQKDIRQIQLAKAALFGGCRVLMSHFRISSINRIIVAGAFGMHIDKENALAIGLLPWCEPDNIVMVGNAAGHGAYLTLVDRAKRTEADRIARWVNHIELALEPEFQKEFLKSLSFPDRGRIDGPITGSSRPSESQRE
jgi:uncharacterized 2Fe-2S/4Fe-4S cluster protein (DUF4445 family)